MTTTTTTMKTMRTRSKQLTTNRNVSRSYGGRTLVRASRRGEIEAFLRKLQSASFDVVVRWKATSGGSKDVTMRSPPRRARLSYLIQKEEGEKKQNNKMKMTMMGKYYLGEGFQRWECPVWSPLYGW